MTQGEGRLIAERYRVEASLGVGGMGAVYRVRDERDDRLVALKELRLPAAASEADNAPRGLLLSQFEREYHTLVQLRHPSIIEVYDYGVEERGDPFYTMELLDGEDVRQRAAPTWRQACALLRDLASSLAMIHSRRLLHRDISTRNIRCTSNGRAKLIDFGAMAPMGVLKHVVGTPPLVPPEALQLQSLDGRADLFALGAVFYWLMVRRHAYPARNFTELPDLWRTPIASPSQYDVELPPALDQLIMQLLALDRNARPGSAAEVIERLCGIAELPADERPAVSAAYLTTPALIGRDALLQQARAQLVSARKGGGGTILIEGTRGSGRSRALDACVLEAKLLGALVVRGEAADGARGDYAVARSLAEQLFLAVPKLARRCAASRKDVLSHALPALKERMVVSLPPSRSLRAGPLARSSAPPRTLIPTSIPGVIPFQTAPPRVSEGPRASHSPVSLGPERCELQVALRDLILSIAHEKHVVLVIDDIDAIDEPSAAWLAALAHSAKRRKLTLLLSAPATEGPAGTSAAVLGLLRQLAQRVELTPLDPEQTEALLRSVFGEVPNVAAVSACVHRVAAGNPSWTLELADHLVSRGLARYEAGSWALPEALAPGDIPASLSERFAARLAALHEDARGLAEALALTDPALIPLSEYSRLTDHADRARTYAALSTLASAGVLLAAGDGYRFGESGLALALRARLEPERARLLHGRLAGVLQSTPHLLQLAEHQLLGGREHDGIESLETLCAGHTSAQASRRRLELLEQALEWAESHAQPMRMRAILRCQLLFHAASLGDYARFVPRLAQVRTSLERESGLADYHELPDIPDPVARAHEALECARRRFAVTAAHERAFPPEEACAWLGHLWSACVDMAAIAQDITLLEDLLPTAPLLPAAPVLRGIDQFVDCQRAMQAGRFPEAGQRAAAMLKALAGPAFADVPPEERARLRIPYVYILALFSSILGRPAALEHVKEFEQPHTRSNGWRIRMVYELMHGRTEAAAACQRRAELLALQDSGAITMPGSTTRIELLASVYADDVIGVKRSMGRIEALAAMYPRWTSTLAIARAHYRRLQGDFEAGLTAAREALALAPAGRHFDWALAASTELALLKELNRAEEALVLGEQYVATGAAERLSSARAPLLRAMAECCVQLGHLDRAVRLADEHLAGHLELGTQGLQLGLAYETRARVAVAMRDDAAVHHYARLCATEYKASRNASLSRKYQQLLREADVAGVTMMTMERHAADVTSGWSASNAVSTLDSTLLTAVGRDERAAQALHLLLAAVGGRGGYLFNALTGQPELLAASPTGEPSDDLVRTLNGYVGTLSQVARRESEREDDEATVMHDCARDPATDAAGFEFSDSHTAGIPDLDMHVDGFDVLPLFAKRGSERVLVALAAVRFAGARRAVAPHALAALANALLGEPT